MSNKRFITGVHKFCIFLVIIFHVPIYYLRQLNRFSSPLGYLRFLWRAFLLLMVFRHNKVVRVSNGYKLHLYLPAWPSRAFFYAIESKLLRSPPGPTTVVFSMTKACSYHCQHCYQKLDHGKDLDEALMTEVANQMVDAGVAMMDIEGGEPLLRFGRLSVLLNSIDERCELWVNTTGAGLKEGQIGQLKKSGLFGVMVSIHSPVSDAHDKFTGVEGSFQVACDFIRNCSREGLTVAINTVLVEEDLQAEKLDELMGLATDLGCHFVQLIHPKPAGSWLSSEGSVGTSAKMIQYAHDAHIRYNNRASGQMTALSSQVFEESIRTFGCTAGAIERFYIGASGEVQPCEFLNISFGNVNEESFETIYQRMRSYFPQPGTDWLCCTQARAIYQLMKEHDIQQTPLPWPLTKKLVEEWSRGVETPLYKRLGIYK